LVNLRSELLICVFLGVLVCSLFYSSFVQAAIYPDLSVVSVAPYNAWGNGKYVEGYRVVIANYGSAASPVAPMCFYARTYDGKTLNKNFTVPEIQPGKAKGIKFTMNKGTDGSFKNGYVVINKNKAFRELKYSNNARNFGLKETLLRSSNKTVTETYTTVTPAVPQTWSGKTYNYNSPASGKTGITRMYVKVDTNLRYIYGCKIVIPMNGTALHDKISLNLGYDYYKSSDAVKSWNDTTMEIAYPHYMSSLSYIAVTVTGDNLESKNVFNEPIKIYKRDYVRPPVDDFVYNEICQGSVRNVQEDYCAPLVSSNSKTYVGTDVSSYSVHNQNVTSLKILGDPRGYYVAGWFIQPKGNVSSVNALYGSGSCSASYATAGYWGVRHCCVGLNSVGFKINGTNLQGFSNFRSFGFTPWTWKEQY
jgi:hypothetical protein